jgi:hypothetical protein
MTVDEEPFLVIRRDDHQYYLKVIRELVSLADEQCYFYSLAGGNDVDFVALALQVKNQKVLFPS